MSHNIILNTDSYKVSMFNQYPPGTEYVFSYIESRGGKYAGTMMFGFQMFAKEYLSKPITQENIDEAKEFWPAHMGVFNEEGWNYILKEHGGKLPVCIKAVPEGTLVPSGNILLSIVNTDPKCFWLTTYLETALLRAIWYPTTVATRSFVCKQIIKHYLDLTSDDPEGSINFKLHDFGARGVSSRESAGIGGAAHLVNFMGSDNADGILYARKYYGEKMAGFSIPAAEHSTITSWGRENEADAYENMLKQYAKPGSLVACVSDSYDIYNAVTNIWGKEFKQKILDSGATLVVRPDSGDPAEVVLECVKRLDEAFGSTVNSKGYKVLNPAVRGIQGDGINEYSIWQILNNLYAYGYSADNVAFGMGGELLQGMTRDTNRWAMKCSAIYINGDWRDVYKDPVTDSGKRSKKGLLALVRDENGYNTVPDDGEVNNLLRTVYNSGYLVNEETFVQIRARANRQL